MMGHVFHVISIFCLHCAPHKITHGSSLLMEKSKVEESPRLEKQTSKKKKKKKTGSKKKKRKSTILWQLCSLLCCPPQRSTEQLRLKKKCLQCRLLSLGNLAPSSLTPGSPIGLWFQEARCLANNLCQAYWHELFANLYELKSSI